jgi:hypothetical protein
MTCHKPKFTTSFLELLPAKKTAALTFGFSAPFIYVKLPKVIDSQPELLTFSEQKRFYGTKKAAWRR